MEIKFRGVHPQTKELMDVCCIDWMHDEVWFVQGTDVTYPIEQCQLMQYTGLNDCNGVEIYEGDIICDNENHAVDSVSKSKDDTWTWDGEVVADFNEDSLEVIGNIHENPELLEPPK